MDNNHPGRTLSAAPPPIVPLSDRISEGESDLLSLTQIGGVFHLHSEFPANLDDACEAYPLKALMPPLIRHAPKADENQLKRMWPWIASAVICWRVTYERAMVSADFDSTKAGQRSAPWYVEPQLKPTEIQNRFERIGKNARQIVDDLNDLVRTAEAANPLQQRQAAHVNGILTAMMLGVDYDFDLELLGTEPSPEIIAQSHASRAELIASLNRLSTLSNLLTDKIDSNELKRQKTPTDPAITILVRSLVHVWKAIHRKTPSIARTIRSNGPDASGFVLFVIDVAKAGRQKPAGQLFQSIPVPPEPTVDQVETAMCNLQP